MSDRRFVGQQAAAQLGWAFLACVAFSLQWTAVALARQAIEKHPASHEKKVKTEIKINGRVTNFNELRQDPTEGQLTQYP
jgi:hypothetical protein